MKPFKGCFRCGGNCRHAREVFRFGLGILKPQLIVIVRVDGTAHQEDPGNWNASHGGITGTLCAIVKPLLDHFADPHEITKDAFACGFQWINHPGCDVGNLPLDL